MKSKGRGGSVLRFRSLIDKSRGTTATTILLATTVDLGGGSLATDIRTNSKNMSVNILAATR